MAATGSTPISLYYSTTASTAPTNTNLVNGELAINITDGKLYYKDNAGVVQVIAGKGGAGVAGGSNTQVQYNSSGSLAGSANLTFNGTTLTLANDASISGLTVGKGTASLRNTVVGNGALNANTTGVGGTYIGYQTGYTNTTGASCTFIGEQSGYFNTVGSYNTSVGQGSYASNSTTATGSYNTSVGSLALYNNTTASNNTAVGYQAGYSNTTATNITFIGYQAGYSNQTGYGLTFVGNSAGYSNTASDNTAYGWNALRSNTTGVMNTALGGGLAGSGAGSLQSNTTGGYNTAVGHQSLASNTTASNNTAVGYQAGYSNSTGTSNVMLGYGAGYASTAGLNTLVGYSSGSAVSTGTNNTFVGYVSGYLMTTGSKNTILGTYNGNQGGLDIRTASNYIVLSDGDGNPRVAVNNNGDTLFGGLKTDPTFNRSNGVNIGNNGSILSRSAAGWDCGISSTSGVNLSFYTDNGSARVTAGYISSNGSVTAYNVTSDYRLKQNIAPLQNSLAKVLQLKPCSYNYIEGNQYSEGFVAHELQAIIPEAVTGEKDAVNADGSIKAQGVDTSFLVATLVSAIQELKTEFDAYKTTHP